MDLFRFLQTRFLLSSYSLRNVLVHFSCDVKKVDFNSTDIRRMYYNMNDGGPVPALSRVLRYNMFDCLSVSALFDSLNFFEYVTVMARYFRSDVVRAMYKGNSCNIPPRLMCEALRRKNELVPFHRPEQLPLMISSSRCWNTRKNNFVENCRISISSWTPMGSCSCATRDSTTCESLAFDELFDYAAPCRFVQFGSDSSFSPNFYACGMETDVVRVLDRTYIGGLNMSFPGHARNPTFVDFDSFYPSIMRHFDIYLDNVRVFRLGELLLSFGGARNLQLALDRNCIRLFDYEPESSPRRVWNDDALPPWYEGIEMRDVDRILATSVCPERRFMALFRREDEGALKIVLGDSLERRGSLKLRLRNDAAAMTEQERTLVKCHEQMEKVFSNSIYGSLNYSRGLLYRPSAAACVTLLCRKTTREAIRLAGTNGFDTIYVDTDGFIVIPKAGCDVEDRFDSKIVNDGLSMRYVNLSNENDDAVSVSIFGDKKYSLARSDGSVKLNGYEKNAPAPIRRVFALLTRVVHFALIARSPRRIFRLRVLEPVKFFEAFYECCWHCQGDLSADDTDERLVALAEGRLDGCRSTRIDEYCLNVPLNSRDDNSTTGSGGGGALAAFIERTLRERGYCQGEHARSAFVENVRDDETSSSSADCYRANNSREARYVLYEDIVSDVSLTIDLYHLAKKYVRYILQTVEGHKRDDWSDEFETKAYVGWSERRRVVDNSSSVLSSVRVDSRYKRLFSSETLRRVSTLPKIRANDANDVSEAEYALELSRVFGLQYIRVDDTLKHQ